MTGVQTCALPIFEAGRAAEAVELLEGIPPSARNAAIERNLHSARQRMTGDPAAGFSDPALP